MLDGFRVIDLTMHLSGPYCTWLLSHLGADVIKVERPGGDPARRTAPFVDGESLYFASVNRNKRSIVLDLKHETDLAVLQRLIGTADALVENYRPGVMGRLGLDAEAVGRINPRLVLASISGFGQDGPFAGRPAFDIIAQAMSGIMSVTGPEGGEPVRVGVSIGDMAAAVFAALDIVAALVARERSGAVRHIDVSMLDCQIALLENAISRNLNVGEVPRPLGSRHPLVTPFQSFSAADAPFVLGVDGDESWQRLCAALALDDMGGDDRLASRQGRNAHQKQIERRLSEIFRTQPRDHWLTLIEGADIACGPLNNVSDAMASPQVEARSMISSVERPGEAPRRYAAAPIGHRGGRRERPAPRLDEHAAEIRAELGLAPVSR